MGKTDFAPARLIPLTMAMLLALGCASQRPTPNSRPGNEWAERIATAYGGRAALARTRSLAFDFVSYEDGVEKARFHHVFAVNGGPCLYETDAATFARSPFVDDQTHTWKPIGLDVPAGRLVARVDRATRTGEVRVNGAPQPETLVRRVVERINNDAFWLMLPFQLDDPGVRLSEIGPVTLPDGRAATALSLSFGSDAGATPGDRWTLFVDRSTARILKTRVDLQGGASYVEAEWRGSAKTGGLDLADERVLGKRIVRFERVNASEQPFSP